MNTWLMRPNPDGKNRIDEFHNDNIIAIGWPELQSQIGQTCDNIRSNLASRYRYEGHRLGNATATVNIFVNRMQKGDIALVPNGDDIFFAMITSDYYFDGTSKQNGFPHQRSVRWLHQTTRRDLSEALQASLRAQRTSVNLSHHTTEIMAIAKGNPSPVTTTIDVTYPLRPDFTVSFKIPDDISKPEADRLSKYFGSLYFKY